MGLRALFLQNGGSVNGQFGFSVAATKDVNRDSIPLLIVGAPGVNGNAGTVFIYALKDTLRTLFLHYQRSGGGTGDQFGFSVAEAGDVNGDTAADFIVGAPQISSATSGGMAFVYSGKTGALLYQQVGNATGNQFGRSVAGVGDVNGDGKADFIVGAPGGNDAFVYSGATGALLYQKMGDAPGSEFGHSVAGVGDINGDDRTDFIVGAIGTGKGSAFVYSGVDGALLYKLNGAFADSGFGFSIGGGGDANGDSIPDFVVGSPLSSPAGLSEAGSVYVYSGSTGALLYSKNGAAVRDRLGWSVADAGDFNFDKRAEIIVGAPSDTLSGAAFVYSGATGNLLSWVLGAKEYRLGYSVAGAGDIYRDGFPDVLVGVPFVAHFKDSTRIDTLFEAGSVYVFSAR